MWQQAWAAGTTAELEMGAPGRTEDGKQKGAVIGTLSIQLAFSEPMIHKRLNGNCYGEYKGSFTPRRVSQNFIRIKS